jgi:glycine reductase
VGAPRIVRGKAITNVAGDPNLRPSDEKALRKEIVNKALKALTTPVKEPTAFD